MRYSCLVLLAAIFAAASARAQVVQGMTYSQALTRARATAPDIAVANGREAIARAEVDIAGTYPNPSLVVGTSTQAARASIGASVPLVILGQRGASVRAAEASLATERVDSEVTWRDVRAQTGHAWIALWSAQQIAVARADAAALARSLETAVTGRVEVGAAPEVDALRVRAERLRADADAGEASQLVTAAAADLARFVGDAQAETLRAANDPAIPASPPSLAELFARIGENPSVRRERADARAADARASRERALNRPNLTLDVGADLGDPTLPTTNYRAQLGIEVPLFNQRGGYVDREKASVITANARASAEQKRALAILEVAYRTFMASSERTRALETGVVPAAEAAAKATEESYVLGRAPLVAVVEAERARLDARVALVDARTTRANAWVDVERAVGSP